MMGMNLGFDVVHLGCGVVGLYSRERMWRNDYGTPLLVKGPLDELMREFTPQ